MRSSVKTSGSNSLFNYVVDAAHFQTDGYRVHSNAERNNFNAKLAFDPASNQKLTLVLNAVQTPFVQDPLGLTRAQLPELHEPGAAAIVIDREREVRLRHPHPAELDR